MDGRPILKKGSEIIVLLDSEKFEDLLKKGDRVSEAILRYHDSTCLILIRSPFETEHSALQNIVEYDLNYENNEIKTIQIKTKKPWISRFDCKMEDIKDMVTYLYKKSEINKYEMDKVIILCVQASLNRMDDSNVLITNDNIILENRLWIKSRFPKSLLLNIMTPQEALYYLDLYFKFNDKYLVTNRCSLKKGSWYWHSMHLKLPHYNQGELIIDALAFRLYYALIALDEIGMQFYQGVNNDTMDFMLYHFNYLISLLTGIFDNLALKTNEFLKINFKEQKVSLNNDDFLDKIRCRDKDIREHIAKYRNFIKLIYLFRNQIIHREGLSPSARQVSKPMWEANLIEITEEINNKIKCEKDRDCKIDLFTEWGRHCDDFNIYLEPYRFSIKALKNVIEFTDLYLQLLGYTSFIETQKQKPDSYTKTMISFEKWHLGF